MGSVAGGPASFLSLAYSHRPITQSKNGVAFVETRGEVIVAAVHGAPWLRFLADGAHACPVHQQPLCPPEAQYPGER